MARLLHTISQRLIKPSLIATALTCLTHYPAVLAAVPGAMEGAFGVNASGAATYRIPIEVPPGVNGLQPDLSLAYNSQHGNDHLGIGWALEGLSSITRCPTTLAQDGFIDGVDFDTNDRFCLDGQRLVPIAAGATEYRTEIERFAKITAHGTAGSGPAWFRVETKAGQIMDYGFTADARIEASGRSDVLVWALNTVSDRNGNQMTVSYIEDNGNGEFYPSRIDYAGGQSSVRFEYESRPDVRTKHIAGSVRRVTQRLTHAKTYSGETVVGSYHLAYETQGTTNQSRLTGVRKCDKLGNCLASQLFTWSNENSIGFNQQTFWTTAYGNAGGWNSGASYYSTITYPDINGDGVPDICGRSSAGIYCGLNNGSGFNQPTFWTTSYSNAGGWSSDVSYYSTIRYPDINGDGLADICGRSSAGIYCGLNNGNSFNQPTFWTTSYSNAGGWSSGVSYYSTIRYPDINGDGLADICGRSSVGIYCGLSNGNSFNQPTFWTTAYSNAGGWSSSDSYYGTLRYLDINGDGLADICGRSSAGIYCGLSNGNSFNQPTFWTTAYSNAGGWSSSDSYYGTITYPDINGDRLPDICGRSSAGIYCGLNNGSGFNQPTFWTTAYNNSAGWNSSDSYYGTITYPDINGDGLADICGRSSAGISCELNSVEKANLLSDVSKSLGAGTQIAYSPLTDSSIYTKGSGAVYPEQGVQYARYVVGQVESDNGLGGKRTRTYKYSGLKEDLRRRKRLGFASMSVTDQASGITTTTQYSQSFPTIGFEVSKVDTYDNGTPSTTDDIILSAQSHIPASPADPPRGALCLRQSLGSQHLRTPPRPRGGTDHHHRHRPGLQHPGRPHTPDHQRQRSRLKRQHRDSYHRHQQQLCTPTQLLAA